MKSSVQHRKQLVRDAQVEHTAPLSDLRPDMIVKSAPTTRSIPKPVALLLASARSAPTGSPRRPALIPKTNACNNAPVARGPAPATYLIAPPVRPEHPPRPAPSFSAIVRLAVQAPLPVLADKPNATSALPELGVHQQVKAV